MIALILMAKIECFTTFFGGGVLSGCLISANCFRFDLGSIGGGGGGEGMVAKYKEVALQEGARWVLAARGGCVPRGYVSRINAGITEMHAEGRFVASESVFRVGFLQHRNCNIRKEVKC